MHLDDSFSPSWGCFNAEKLCDDKIYQRNGESLWYERDIYFTAGLLFPWGDISVFSFAEILLQKMSAVRNGTKWHPGPCRLGAAGFCSQWLGCQAAWSGKLLRLLRKPLFPNTNSNITSRVRGFLKMHNFPLFFLNISPFLNTRTSFVLSEFGEIGKAPEVFTSEERWSVSLAFLPWNPSLSSAFRENWVSRGKAPTSLSRLGRRMGEASWSPRFSFAASWWNKHEWKQVQEQCAWEWF